MNGRIQVRMPRDVLRNWLRRYTKENKPFHRCELINLSDYDIVMRYNLELRGLYNYYCDSVNVHKLNELKFRMKGSLARTLANKHKSKLTKIYKRYTNPNNKAIEVRIPRKNKKSLIASFGDLKLRRKKDFNPNQPIDKYVTVYSKRTELLSRLLADRCELCNKENDIQVHHIKKISDLKRKYEGKRNILEWKKRMISMNRKTLVVCRNCHKSIHSGKYDGKKLTKL